MKTIEMKINILSIIFSELKGGQSHECFSNPKTPNFRITEKILQSLLNEELTSEDKNNVPKNHFGGLEKLSLNDSDYSTAHFKSTQSDYKNI